MTSGLKTPSSYYIQLITTFPPRPITNELELIATQDRINSILDSQNLSQDDRDYLKVLGTLVYDYEQQHEAIPTLKGVELLKALLEESNLQPQDLTSICGTDFNFIQILDGEYKLSKNQINSLATFFKVSPHYFD